MELKSQTLYSVHTKITKYVFCESPETGYLASPDFTITIFTWILKSGWGKYETWIRFLLQTTEFQN